MLLDEYGSCIVWSNSTLSLLFNAVVRPKASHRLSIVERGPSLGVVVRGIGLVIWFKLTLFALSLKLSAAFSLQHSMDRVLLLSRELCCWWFFLGFPSIRGLSDSVSMVTARCRAPPKRPATTRDRLVLNFVYKINQYSLTRVK